MSIKRLESVVAPPQAPVELPEARIWDAVEVNLTKLPADYKEFTQRYGTGCIDSFIWIFNPASENPNLNLGRQAWQQASILKEINECGAEPLIPSFPSPHGMLAFGITDNGDVLYWETNGDPDSWTVAVLGARSSPILKFEFNLTSFLAGICEGVITCELFPEGFPSPAPIFATGY